MLDTVNVLLPKGDTTEFHSNPRQYHGIRIYDLGADDLVEKQFIPVHGVMDFTMKASRCQSTNWAVGVGLRGVTATPSSSALRNSVTIAPNRQPTPHKE